MNKLYKIGLALFFISFILLIPAVLLHSAKLSILSLVFGLSTALLLAYSDFFMSRVIIMSKKENSVERGYVLMLGSGNYIEYSECGEIVGDTTNINDASIYAIDVYQCAIDELTIDLAVPKDIIAIYVERTQTIKTVLIDE